MAASSVDFHETPWQPRSVAPRLGEHSEEILAELGSPNNVWPRCHGLAVDFARVALNEEDLAFRDGLRGFLRAIVTDRRRRPRAGGPATTSTRCACGAQGARVSVRRLPTAMIARGGAVRMARPRRGGGDGWIMNSAKISPSTVSGAAGPAGCEDPAPGQRRRRSHEHAGRGPTPCRRGQGWPAGVAGGAQHRAARAERRPRRLAARVSRRTPGHG